MQKKHFFFAGAVVCLLAAGWGYYQYQKPRTSAADIRPAFRLTATQLFNEYASNEATADAKYNGKVVEVQGVVKEMQHTATASNLLLDSGSPMGGVSCSFQSVQKELKTGESVTVKGRCAGFLMDVNLVDATAITK